MPIQDHVQGLLSPVPMLASFADFLAAHTPRQVLETSGQIPGLTGFEWRDFKACGLDCDGVDIP